MPSPFPGMDPYLENPGLWPDVHHELISVARRMLVRSLDPRYIVSVEERVYLSTDDDPGRVVLVPDVSVSRHPGWDSENPVQEGGMALGVVEPVIAVTLLTEEIHEPRIEILDRERNQIVTVIEILSPSNKVPGSLGRVSFEEKRFEVMTSPSHWVEIDLLRGGEPMRFRGQLRPHEYLVHVSEVSRRPRGLLWPIRPPHPLPVITVPLKEADPPVPLDLQQVLTQAYDEARYGSRINYGSEPVPPLPAEWAEWADRRLREQGLRP